MSTPSIESENPDRSVIFSQTLLRVVIGGLLIMHGIFRLLQLDVPGEDWIQHFDGLDVHMLTRAVAALEIAAGAGLAWGFMTRLCALVLICRSAIALATHYQSFGMKGAPGELELPLVLLSAAILFCATGGGAFSLDSALRARRQRKAIEDDSIWLRPPYTESPGGLDQPRQ